MQKVRWGVIGAGGIADRRTIPGMLLSENARLIAVMDLSGETAEMAAKKYSVENYYDNEDKLLEEQNIDAVYIASPVAAHYEQAVKTAKAGKHILMEKPLALDTKQGKELIAVCAVVKLHKHACGVLRVVIECFGACKSGNRFYFCGRNILQQINAVYTHVHKSTAAGFGERLPPCSRHVGIPTCQLCSH